MNFKWIIKCFACFTLLACSTKSKIEKIGIVQLKTVFYDSSGVPSIFFKKLWYRDSLTIEQVDRANFETKGAKRTVTYSTILFRFIDLEEKVFYDYKTFSDTSTPFYKKKLPDTVMKDYGWSYYSDKVRKIEGMPQYLNDTVIGNINYKRMKFRFIGDHSNVYKIGYMRCDGKGILFSLEKNYSKRSNCAMTRFEDFVLGNKMPSATMEIEFISDTLTAEELNIFDAWKKNEKKHPIKN